MSKKAKLLAKARNRSNKSARRDANREMWRGLAAQGNNKKKKGFNAKKKFNPFKHSVAVCGNIGCKKCSPYIVKKKKQPTFQDGK